jgi:hypothetical protein
MELLLWQCTWSAIVGASMALYTTSEYLRKVNDVAFYTDLEPGATAMHAGIYRCMGCGREIVLDENESLPAQNHHQHTINRLAIRWRLIVYADDKAK